MSAQTDLTTYYAARASDYERVYEKPERQRDLVSLRQLLAAYFDGRRVLEVACGTGYWTAVAAPVAATVLATDLTPSVLTVAKAKRLPPERVEFRVADAFDLSGVPGTFDAALAGFWWSHVRSEDLPRFLTGLHRRVGKGARVLFMDNRYVEGSNMPITRTDPLGNTYQRRNLSDGGEYEVLKNFPTPAQVQRTIAGAGGGGIAIVELQYYWVASYSVVGTS